MTDAPVRQEFVKRRVRFVVPAREPWGLPVKELELAIIAAKADRERRGLRNDFDDCLRFMAEDSDGGEIVIFFDVEEAAAPAPEPLAIMPCLHVSEHNATIGWPGHAPDPHSIRVEASCCGRESCRTRLTRQIADVVGHRPTLVALTPAG